MNKKQQAHAEAVQAVINADMASKNANTLGNEYTKALENAVSAVEVACAHSYKASLAGVTGADIARDAKVSEMTVSRYIAGGKVAHQTDGKVTGSKAVSDMGNGYITVGQVKNAENASQYAKAVTAGKNAKNGKNGKADKREPIEVAKAHLEQVTKAITAGKITLEQVTDIWAELLAQLEVSEIEEMQEV
jgi:hypothetical protein